MNRGTAVGRCRSEGVETSALLGFNSRALLESFFSLPLLPPQLLLPCHEVLRVDFFYSVSMQGVQPLNIVEELVDQFIATKNNLSSAGDVWPAMLDQHARLRFAKRRPRGCRGRFILLFCLFVFLSFSLSLS